MEIRIVLDRAEPPAGRLRVVRAAGQAAAPRTDQEIGFTGWLDRLAGALEAADARHLVLHPLTGEAVTGLVAQAVAAEPGPRLLAHVSGAAGNPLFVTELLGALAREGAITTVGGRCCRRRCG